MLWGNTAVVIGALLNRAVPPSPLLLILLPNPLISSFFPVALTACYNSIYLCFLFAVCTSPLS